MAQFESKTEEITFYVRLIEVDVMNRYGINHHYSDIAE
jgi:hypothetical protein